MSHAAQAAALSTAVYVVLRIARIGWKTPAGRGVVVTFLSLALVYAILAVFDGAAPLPDATQCLIALSAFAVLLQGELRQTLSRLGASIALPGHSRPDMTAEACMAAKRLSRESVGGLIAIEASAPLNPFADSGIHVDAQVSAFLIETIFHLGTRLHDGAIILGRGRILAASCILPLSVSSAIDPSVGTRHRAALGLVEETDAVVIVVSEETGRMSVAANGKIEFDVPADRLEDTVRANLEGRSTGSVLTRSSRVRLRSLATELVWVGGSAALALALLSASA